MLQNKRKWNLGVYVPDQFEALGEKANRIATRGLIKLSTFALWRRYCRWRKDTTFNKYIKNDNKYFEIFISQVCFDLAHDKLKGMDRLLWEDVCYFDFNFK
jgi:hypothetical protein